MFKRYSNQRQLQSRVEVKVALQSSGDFSFSSFLTEFQEKPQKQFLAEENQRKPKQKEASI